MSLASGGSTDVKIYLMLGQQIARGKEAPGTFLNWNVNRVFTNYITDCLPSFSWRIELSNSWILKQLSLAFK